MTVSDFVFMEEFTNLLYKPLNQQKISHALKVCKVLKHFSIENERRNKHPKQTNHHQPPTPLNRATIIK
jgi:hypothetical protein